MQNKIVVCEAPKTRQYHKPQIAQLVKCSCCNSGVVGSIPHLVLLKLLSSGGYKMKFHTPWSLGGRSTSFEDVQNKTVVCEDKKTRYFQKLQIAQLVEC